MNREDFSYHATAEGYMLRYKGKDIGGAGIMGKYSGYGRQRTAQMRSYIEACEREINLICNGQGQPRFMQAIRDIDEGNTK